MAKEASDVTPPKWATPNANPTTADILRAADTSAKPPVAPSKSGDPMPQNKRP
jgi:hypothetical protein